MQGFAAPRHKTPRPCILRAVLHANSSRRTAPPGIKNNPVSSSYQRREPDCSRQNIIGDEVMIHHSIHFKEILISGIFSTALLGQIPQQKRDLIDRAMGHTGAYEKDAYTVTIPRDEATIVWNDQK